MNFYYCRILLKQTTFVFELRNIEFKQKTCPLVFKNSGIDTLMIDGLVDTFYKKNLLKFSNEIETDLDSKITRLDLKDTVNIDLDLNIIHPSVFNYTNEINFNSFLNSISGDIFERLKNLSLLNISDIVFRKINHKQGIKWIRQWNKDINVNLNNIKDNSIWYKEIKTLHIRFGETKLPTIFPEEGFCIFVDFPFNQLIIIYRDVSYKNEEFTCTFMVNSVIYKDNKSLDLVKMVNSSAKTHVINRTIK